MSNERETLLVTLLGQAVAAMKSGNLNVAVEVLQSLVKEQPDFADAWYLLGVMANQSGDYASAVTLLSRACELKPNQPDYLVVLCKACAASGAVEDAQTCIDLLTQIAPAKAQEIPVEIKFQLLSRAPVRLLPESVEFWKALRRIHQQAILHCVHHGCDRWWATEGMQHLFLGHSVDVLRHFLRVMVLRRTGDWRTFLRLSRELDSIGAAASDEDRFLQQLALRYDEMMAGIRSAAPSTFDRPVSLLDITVWGGTYIDNFLDRCVPSLLAVGNLELLCRERRVVLLIHTDAAGEAQLRASSKIAAIVALGVECDYMRIPTELLDNIHINGNCKYWMLGMTQSLGLYQARTLGADFHALYPDTMFSADYFANMLRIAAQGVPAILQTAFRTDVSKFVPLIAPYRCGDAIEVPVGDLLALSLNCIHETWRNVLVNRRVDRAHWPSFHALMWEEEGALHLACPHLAAVFLSATTLADLPDRYFFTIDSEIDKILADPATAYMPSAIDGLGIIELSESDLQADPVTPVSPHAYAALFWSRTETVSHLRVFDRSIAFAVNPSLRQYDAPPALPQSIAVDMAEVRALVAEHRPAVSSLATMNGLLCLHMAEMHPQAEAQISLLHREAGRIWAAGRAALGASVDAEQARQIMRMLWHFDQLPAARDFLATSRPTHFLIEAIDEWHVHQRANSTWASKDRADYLLGATVWGTAYLAFFLNYHIASLLAPGNLPALARQGRVILSIVTDEAGKAHIESSAIVVELLRFAEIRWTVVKQLPRRDDGEAGRLFYMHYGLLEHLHVELARSLAANLILLPVDTVVSAQALSTLSHAVADGYDACSIAGIEGYRKPLQAGLDALRCGHALVATAAQLGRLVMSHPSRYFKSLVVDSREPLNAYPREFFWKVESGFICHSLFMHPLILSARSLGDGFHPNHENTDWALIPRALRNTGKMRVLDSSDDLFIIHCSEDTPRAFEMSPYTGRPTRELGGYLQSVHSHDYPIHRRLFQHAMHFAIPNNSVAAQSKYASDIGVFKAWFSGS